jgi:hypothetical protein
MNQQRLTAMSPLFAAPFGLHDTPQPADPYAAVWGNIEEQQVQNALAKLKEARVPFTAHDRDRRLVLHAEGRARVEYFPLKNRWRTADSAKRHHGTPEQFVAWFREYEGVAR